MRGTQIQTTAHRAVSAQLHAARDATAHCSTPAPHVEFLGCCCWLPLRKSHQEDHTAAQTINHHSSAVLLLLLPAHTRCLLLPHRPPAGTQGTTAGRTTCRPQHSRPAANRPGTPSHARTGPNQPDSSKETLHHLAQPLIQQAGHGRAARSACAAHAACPGRMHAACCRPSLPPGGAARPARARARRQRSSNGCWPPRRSAHTPKRLSTKTAHALAQRFMSCRGLLLCNTRNPHHLQHARCNTPMTH